MLSVLVSTISNSHVFLLKSVSSFCKCKSYSHFSSKNNSIYMYAIFNDQSFNDTLTNDIVSFKQLGPGQRSEYIPLDMCTQGWLQPVHPLSAEETLHPWPSKIHPMKILIRLHKYWIFTGHTYRKVCFLTLRIKWCTMHENVYYLWMMEGPNEPAQPCSLLRVFLLILQASCEGFIWMYPMYINKTFFLILCDKCLCLCFTIKQFSKRW